MAVAVARVPSTCTHIPIGILALAMKVETEAFVAETAELITLFGLAIEGVQEIRARLVDLETKVTKSLDFVGRLVAETEPLWDDSFNLCGDSACDGTCMVCQDGEYLGEEDVDEKYCRRGRR